MTEIHAYVLVYIYKAYVLSTDDKMSRGTAQEQGGTLVRSASSPPFDAFVTPTFGFFDDARYIGVGFLFTRVGFFDVPLIILYFINIFNISFRT